MWQRLSPQLGIDLGTTNVLVFVPNAGVVLNEPSVVAVSDDGQVLAVGAEAKQMIGRTPEAIRAYRPMKDGVIADYRVTEAMLTYYIRKALPRAETAVADGQETPGAAADRLLALFRGAAG